MMDTFMHWMSGATVTDWILHIVAVALALYFSVPGLWWPHVEKFMKKKKEREEREHNQSQETPHIPPSK
jgi:hypothetical protein